MSISNRFARMRAGAVQAGLLLRVVAGLAILIGVAGGTGYWMLHRADEVRTESTESASVGDPPAVEGPMPGTIGGIPIFAGWPKAAPDLVLVVSGQSFGYLQPCG